MGQGGGQAPPRGREPGTAARQRDAGFLPTPPEEGFSTSSPRLSQKKKKRALQLREVARRGLHLLCGEHHDLTPKERAKNSFSDLPCESLQL